MAEAFCPHCGTRTDGNTSLTDKTGYKDLSCPVCGISIKFIITKPPYRTLEEADAIFQATPLTDKKAVRAQKRRDIVHKAK